MFENVRAQVRKLLVQPGQRLAVEPDEVAGLVQVAPGAFVNGSLIKQRTADAPAIGYDAAAAIAKEASAKGTTIREMAKQKTNLSDAELDELLNLENMTEPGIGAGGPGGGG